MKLAYCCSVLWLSDNSFRVRIRMTCNKSLFDHVTWIVGELGPQAQIISPEGKQTRNGFRFLCFFFNNISFLTLVQKKWKQKDIIFVRALHVYSSTVRVPRSYMNYRLTGVGAPLKHPVVVTVVAAQLLIYKDENCAVGGFVVWPEWSCSHLLLLIGPNLVPDTLLLVWSAAVSFPLCFYFL